jgi:V/A-type H+-transporting ATPase subunit F
MQFDRIAVVGERELVLGFKLVGVSDVFISEGDDAVKLLSEFMASKEYGLIIVSNSVKRHLGTTMLRHLEMALKPLVMFIPALTENEGEESVEALAKRVLGVDIRNVKVK